MPFKSQAQVRYMYSQRPEIARRWAATYKQNIKSLPDKKKLKKQIKKAHENAEILEFVFGQPGHPSPADPLSKPPVNPIAKAAVAASRIPNAYTRKERRSLARQMLRIAKRVRYRLKKMGYIKGENDGQIQHPALVKAITGK